MGLISQVGWVDFSSTDRDRVKQVLGQLNEPGTLDELGIGALRDAFADRMFPGFSTIQTRAKYLITVPRMIRDYLLLSTSDQRRTKLDKYLRERENELARVLTKLHGESETGIIGSTKIDTGGVARLPSSVYWGALRVWGLVNTTVSLGQFQREIAVPEPVFGCVQQAEDDDPDGLRPLSRVKLDRFEPEWFENLSILLTRSESSFLIERLHMGPVNSFPTQFELHGLMNEALDDSRHDFNLFAEWGQRQLAFSAAARNTLKMAAEFSELIYGAHLRFNCLLARRNERDDLVASHESSWQEWISTVQSNSRMLNNWLADTEARLPRRTTIFLQKWISEVGESKQVDLLDQLVKEQAEWNKGERTLLKKRLPPDYTWIGMGRLNYRWSNVRTILKDIQIGLA
ncbi:MAG: hypothetical protein KBD82_07700 [Rhodoferax sp.]|jgi:hypothetical protein|uniref:DUF6361 family protein n=1 Tax=Rhodoferax sp. TaxID=50421 RepID=UPI001B5D34D6|nr:DUF6361 family protein [Rhodoferax sp.]MBP9735501.1 hypothetical protein [Rhodoferax sp.]